MNQPSQSMQMFRIPNAQVVLCASRTTLSMKCKQLLNVAADILLLIIVPHPLLTSAISVVGDGG